MATFRDADPNTPGIQIRRDANGTLQGDTSQSKTNKTNRSYGPAGSGYDDAILRQIRSKNLPADGVPKSRTTTEAKIVDAKGDNDWRVSISIPPVIKELGSNLLEPLSNSGDRMIFPFNPTVLLSHSANYAQVAPTHTNYPYNAYENSQVDAITLNGEFYKENQNDALYWIACLHFLRSATKMFYGDSNPLGNPPVVCRLNGYGKHVLNNIPVVITNFTTDLPTDVDYIQTTCAGRVNYVPTQSSITVTLQPQYARRSQAGFSLNQFAGGGHVGGDEGFV